MPVSLLVPHIERFLGSLPQKFSDSDVQMGPLQILAHRAGVSDTLIYRMLVGKKETILFHTADQIVCGMGDPTLWYEGELGDLYWEYDLTRSRYESLVPPKNRCVASGCSNTFDPVSHGGNQKKYCSEKCKSRARSAARRGSRSRERRRLDTCPKGHDRSNSYVVQHHTRGRTELRCLLCENERKAAA